MVFAIDERSGMPETELVRRAREDWQSPYADALMMRYMPYALTCAARWDIADPCADAEDIAHRALMDALEKYDPGKDATFKTYLTLRVNQIAWAEQRSARRRANAAQVVSLDSSEGGAAGLQDLLCGSCSAETEWLDGQVHEPIQKALGYLPEIEQTIVLASVLDGYSNQEVARLVDMVHNHGMNDRSVIRARNRALGRLAQYLEGSVADIF
ncbi:hypothetical protein AUJ68_00745 [Candidatus Woesearchaeota archaeon CG1_02_57_44]|nr:MAG: hypothetical protein AUJ68_00745 [Candidatus Woesearchaeota archaeon CG1_02_57_44]